MRPCCAAVIGVHAVAALATATALAQPAAPARVIAEWEPALGTIISWPLALPSQLVVELARDDRLYVLVSGQAAENQARATLSSWGIDLDHCEFIHTSAQTEWTRDWGPHQIFDATGTWSIVDPIFEGYPWVANPCVPINSPGGYVGDNAVNLDLAAYFGAPLFSFPAYLTGGNFLVDGHAAAFSTCAMVGENQQLWTQQQFLDLAEQWLGVSDYHIVDNTEDFGIQHIDCWMKPLDAETLLVKLPPVWHEEYPRIEANLQELAGATNAFGRPYRIIRIACPPYGNDEIAAYTNSLILNGKVFVPLFNIPGDLQALQTFREALPGHEVIGFPWGAWYYYDALHCRTRALFDRHMLAMSHRPLDSEVPFDPAGHRVEVTIDDRSEAGLIVGALKLHWRAAGTQTWQEEVLTATGEPDLYEAWIPSQPSRVDVEYYLAAADESGRAETLPRTAPQAHYGFTIADHGFTLDVTDPPLLVTPGATTPFAVTIDPADEMIVADSAQLFAATDGSTFHAYPLTHDGGDAYTAVLPRARCNETIEYYVQAEGTQTGLKRLPPLTDIAAQVGVLEPAAVLSADFEAGLPSGWSASGLWHVASTCAGADPCDGVVWAYFGLDGTCSYATGGRTSGSLTSPPLQLPDLPLAGAITLEYCSRLLTEETQGYDVAGVYIGDILIDAPPESSDWQHRQVDLSAFAGQTVTLSFRFDTIDGYANAALGWQVDAVSLFADQLVCVDTCSADLDGDGDVDQADLGTLLAAYGDDHGGDTDGDGDTDQADLGQLLSQYGQSCF